MKTFHLGKDTARLAVLQRSELISPTLKKIRKLFGRYLFTNFFSKNFIDTQNIAKKYCEIMNAELYTFNNYLNNGMDILSIGSGIGGLEVLINANFKASNFTFIEKNYISKKVKYGWDNNNFEAYNNIKLLEKFLIQNGVDNADFDIFDFDKDILPKKKFDLITSIYSLDYHYDFKFYADYLKKICSDETVIIFDTIRAEHFNDVFQNVDIIKEDSNTVHKSKRIACKKFK